MTDKPGEGIEEHLLARIQELRAENEQLRGELMDANPGDLDSELAELAIEKTWRPEVNALSARIKILEARLDQILILANLE
jgi:hypothetical protein